ncbi:YlaF family protein [Bacillus sp. DNRA2]|uniref:YlaF family protein n=1 Tax=Bacillus sp. DNRA2 TaxID=2723053 RepID=UPI002006DC43|nr:YlaF family protein [Bacillus sp. DNRA2]
MNIKWLFLLFAIVTAACIAGIGIAVAERSILGIVGCTIATIASFGLGFSMKKKLLKEQHS